MGKGDAVTRNAARHWGTTRTSRRTRAVGSGGGRGAKFEQYAKNSHMGDEQLFGSRESRQADAIGTAVVISPRNGESRGLWLGGVEQRCTAVITNCCRITGVG